MQTELYKSKETTITSSASTDVPSDFFKKSHAFVFSSLSLSPVEHDIFALLLSRLHADHWQDFLEGKMLSPSYEFKSDILCDWFGAQREDLYNILYKPSDRLSSKKIGVQQEGKSFDFIPLFKRVKYNDGTLTIKPNDDLIAEFLGISQGHAQIPHRSFRRIKTEYGKRLYSMLCRFRAPHTELHPQTIENLRGFFGLLDEKGSLTKKTYAVNANFINRIIKPAIKEIDEKESNIAFFVDEKTGNYGFSYIKEGRKIVGLKFLFEWSGDTANSTRQLSYEDAKRTYNEVVSRSCVPSLRELDNLKEHLVSLGEAGHDLSGGFFTKLRDVTQASEKLPS